MYSLFELCFKYDICFLCEFVYSNMHSVLRLFNLCFGLLDSFGKSFMTYEIVWGKYRLSECIFLLKLSVRDWMYGFVCVCVCFWVIYLLNIFLYRKWDQVFGEENMFSMTVITRENKNYALYENEIFSIRLKLCDFFSFTHLLVFLILVSIFFFCLNISSYFVLFLEGKAFEYVKNNAKMIWN